MTAAPTATQINHAILEEARARAVTYRAEGWDLSGDPYHLGEHTPDLEVLEDRLGRTATQAERWTYEGAIRAALLDLCAR